MNVSSSSSTQPAPFFLYLLAGLLPIVFVTLLSTGYAHELGSFCTSILLVYSLTLTDVLVHVPILFFDSFLSVSAVMFVIFVECARDAG